MLGLEDGLKLYYAGDTNVFGDMALIARIRPDVAILPIGDHFHVGPREAAVAVELLGVGSSPATTEPSHCSGTRRSSGPRPGRRRGVAPEPGETVQL